MGTVRMGPPRELLKNLRDEFNIDTFVETGTFYGSTANWASNEFKKVNTVELSDQHYHYVNNAFGDTQNINLIKGKSQEKLPEIVQMLGTSAIFWLDAHYSGGGTAGQDYVCPLLEELEAIGESAQSNHIFIDDARLVCSPPPRPYSANDWPTISEVVLKIHEELGEDYHITITEDVIVAVPPFAKDIVIKYAQDVATEISNQTKIERGMRMAIDGVLNKLVTERKVRILKMIGLYPFVRKIYNRFSVR